MAEFTPHSHQCTICSQSYHRLDLIKSQIDAEFMMDGWMMECAGVKEDCNERLPTDKHTGIIVVLELQKRVNSLL